MVQLLLDSLPIACLVLDRVFRVTDWNSEAERVFGYAPAEAIGQRVTDLLVPSVAHQVAADQWTSVVAQSPQSTGPMLNRTRSGQLVWCRWKLSSERNPAGDVERIIAVVDEITQQHSAEIALRASEERFRLLIEQAPVPIGIHRRGIGVYCNRAHLQLFGYDANDSLAGKSLLELVGPESRDDIVARHRRRASGEASETSYEFIGLRADGSLFPAATHIFQIELADGPATVVFHTDLTEHHRAKVELERKEQRWRTLLNTVGVAVVTVDQKGMVQGGNKLAQSLFGFSDQVLSGNAGWEPNWQFYLEDGTPLAPSDYPARRVFDTGYAQHDLVVGLRCVENRDQRWYLVHADPVRVSEGMFDEVIVAFLDVTELKTAERVLRESQERFQVAFEQAGIGMAIVDMQGRPILSNSALQAILGHSGDELSERTFAEFAHPDDAALEVALFAELVAGKRTKYHLEKRYLRKDGTVVWGRLTANVVRGAQGEPRYCIGMVEDITEQKHAEAALRVSQELNRRIVEAAAEGIWAIDANERTVFVNRRMCEMLGYSEEELRAHPARDFMPGSSTREFDIHMRRRRAGKVGTRETVFRRKDGSELWVSISGAPLQDRDGRFEGSFGMFTDITDRRRTENALRESEERFRTVLEQAAVGFQVVDVDGSVIEWNRALEAILGITRDQALGREIWDVQMQFALPELRTDANRRLWQNGFERAAMTGEVPHGSKPREVELRLPDGRQCFILQTIFPIRTAAGYRFGQVFLDITESKRAEAASRSAEARLRQAQKMEALGTLAGGVAHDFNNILGAIVGFTQVVYEDIVDHPESQEDLAQVLKACDRAKELVQQILSFSRRAPQERRPTDVGRIVIEAAKLLHSTLPAAISLVVEIADSLTAASADATQLHQVLMNLCTNAAHAMKERGGTLAIRLEAVDVDADLARHHATLRPGSHLRLTVSDTGHGMDAPKLARIFEPFFTTKGPSEGTGLGLSVVHGIIAEHAGAIVVDSEVGRGTTFQLYLPALSVTPTERPPISPSMQCGQQQEILVIDDEPPLGALLNRLLTRLGYRPCVVTNPTHALDLLRREPERFSLVITDLNMPGMTRG